MASEGIICTGCGITLRPFMKTCPRCGLERPEAAPLAPPEPGAGQGTGVVPLDAIRQQQVPAEGSQFAPPRDMVFLSPNDIKRRFPLFTNAQLTLMGIGLTLVILAAVIAWLLWQQQKRDQVSYAGGVVAPVASQPIPIGSISPEPLATPTPISDQAIVDSVKAALMAYSPLGIENYKIDVKDGVITLSGTVDHQPESDGAENVVKLVNGVKSVVNNLKLKPGASTGPIRVNAAEARILDEALRRQVQAAESSGAEPKKQVVADPSKDAAQREADRLRREKLAARQREEELALRKAAEDRLKRESEEFDRRQEEIRRLEAERRARAEQARADINLLRSGTVAWSGLVDGVDEIILTGGSASVRHLSGNTPREVRVSFSAPLPRAPATVKLIASNGRGKIDILQQPAASNGYTTIIRVDDSAKGGDKRYEFTLRWSLQ